TGLVQQIHDEIVGQRERRGDALLGERGRVGLVLPDPDGKVAATLALPEQHDRAVGWQLEADTDQIQLDHDHEPIYLSGSIEATAPCGSRGPGGPRHPAAGSASAPSSRYGS